MLTILSLCDYSGTWSKPYRDAGYDVIQVDLKHGHDIRDFKVLPHPVRGILAAPPCTEFSVSGNRFWKEKDEDGRTAAALQLVDACMRIIVAHSPQWWVLENPVGRLKHWIGPAKMYFNPCDYGDPYTKKTGLWGHFSPPTMHKVEATLGNSPITGLGGKSERTKELRSITPPGFAQAFFEANP